MILSYFLSITVGKYYLQAFFILAAFSSTGAGIWMRVVEMDEIGI